MGELQQLSSQCLRVGVAEATRMSRLLIVSALKRSRGDSFSVLPKCIHCVQERQVRGINAELEFLLEVITKLNSIQIHNAGGMALHTLREQDLVRLAAGGMRNQDVSRKRNIQEHMFPASVFQIVEKLGISNTVELALYERSEPECSQAPGRSTVGTKLIRQSC